MTDFISNPRKALRVPLCCVAHLAVGGTQIEGHTEDVGARGCRVVTALRIEPNTTVGLALDASGATATLRVEARVVWTAANGAWHHGLSYEVNDRPAADGWFDALAAARPELLFFDRVPDRVSVTARVYVAAPQPGPVSDEEVTVLRLACSQPTVADLRERLGVDWSRAQRALFALLSRGVITLDPSQAQDPAGWRTHLGESGAGRHRPN